MKSQLAGIIKARANTLWLDTFGTEKAAGGFPHKTLDAISLAWAKAERDTDEKMS